MKPDTVQAGEPKAERVAYYGGSFDPVHIGHIKIGETLLSEFRLDRFVYLPAFHAPHKVRLEPTSAYDRYAMLCLATQANPRFHVSRIEIEAPERPFTIETLTRLNAERPDEKKYFVMGADSWSDIRTWREWENVLTISDHIVMTRPGYEISFDHVTDEIRRRIVDKRGDHSSIDRDAAADSERRIFFTDSVTVDVSATRIRSRVRSGESSWRTDVPPEVANYIEKYQIYS